MPDNLTPQHRSWLMSRVRQKNTDIELLLRSALHSKGLRFRKHVKTLPGTPDIVFTRAKIAVFVDGDFWHGYKHRQRLPNYKPFWQEKIRGNRARDCRNTRDLRQRGWKVIRVWQHEVKKELPTIVEMIRTTWLKRIDALTKKDFAKS